MRHFKSAASTEAFETQTSDVQLSEATETCVGKLRQNCPDYNSASGGTGGIDLRAPIPSQMRRRARRTKWVVNKLCLPGPHP